MGVHGLWKLIEPSGQIVPLETLAGKVLAVDVSIWLHQAIKGMHDAHGAPVAVAHLLILFHRICKLLFYKIKPVFVFDGGVPALKQQTMAVRRQRTSAAKNEAVKVREKLIKNLLKHEAVRQMLSNETASAALGLNSFTLPGPSVEEDLYKLPPIAAEYVDSESEAGETSEEESEHRTDDIHSVDITSPEFLSLPPEVRHDILTELIETRKQSSWKHLDSMPKKSDCFSDFQMTRLLKRHAVQTSLEKAGKEMGGRALSIKELESLLGDQGILDPKTDLPSKRIAQDNVTRYMLVQRHATEENEKKFDINEHLEDVGWSSESDTDIILERTSKRQKKSDESEIQVSPGEPAKKTEVTYNESDSLNVNTKGKTTKEIDDILSVLEHGNVAVNISENAEDLESNISLNNSLSECTRERVSKPTMDEEKHTTSQVAGFNNAKTSIDELKKVITLPLETSGEVKNEETTQLENLMEQKDVNSFICNDKNMIGPAEEVEMQVDKSADKSEIKASECTVSEILLPAEDGETETGRRSEAKDNHANLGGFKLESLGDAAESPAKVVTSEKTEEVLMSSSDSENDFIPIATTESEQVGQNFLHNSSSSDPISGNSSKPITVVINPLKPDTKDDIFADIFASTADETTKPGGDISGSVEVIDKESLDEIKTIADQFSMGDAELKKSLELERDNLMKERGKQERHALNPTDQMYSDAQEMLRLFGIPFVVAPMEAEAQCATLNTIGLTEGTITDDSDIWLFGGQVVYKNFFNQTKHVLEYRSENIQKHLKLTREELIKMALLVGSDYTVGLSGVGPVTALEILAAFQVPRQGPLDDLQNFRDWFTGQNKRGPQRAALRRKIKNTVMLPGFPNRAVVEAYLNPEVDDSKEPFSWAKPNVEMIRKYVKARLGWTTEKCNELLRPVLKKLEEKTTQSTIQRHFKIIQKDPTTERIFSKRIENAIRRLGSDLPSAEDSEEPEQERKPKKKRKTNSSSSVENTSTKETKTIKKTKMAGAGDSCRPASNVPCGESSKIKLINQKLYQNDTVPQKEMSQKVLENRKQEAIKIFRTFKKGRKKTKVYAKEKIALSESSSSEDD